MNNTKTTVYIHPEECSECYLRYETLYYIKNYYGTGQSTSLCSACFDKYIDDYENIVPFPNPMKETESKGKGKESEGPSESKKDLSDSAKIDAIIEILGIKDQEGKIQSLHEDLIGTSNLLKQAQKDLDNFNLIARSRSDQAKAMYEELLDENDELKKENDELKKENEKLKKIIQALADI